MEYNRENTKTINFLYKVCFNHVKYSFYSGILGDVKVIIDKITGYFNASKLCEQGGKDYKKWISLDRSEILLKYYTNCSNLTKSNESKCMVAPESYKIYSLQSRPCLEGKDYSLQPRRKSYEVEFSGNSDELDDQITGTYIPQELILDLASWVSITFYDKCSRLVIESFMDHNQLNYQIEEAQKQMAQLTINIDKKEKHINKLDELVSEKEHTSYQNIQEIFRSLVSQRDRLVLIKQKTSPTSIVAMLSDINIIILD